MKAKEFYLEFLGMSLDWEHRFEPGSKVFVNTDDLEGPSMEGTLVALGGQVYDKFRGVFAVPAVKLSASSLSVH